MWKPDLGSFAGPTYERIAQALVTDIRTAKLRPGTVLPSHRDLAYVLGVTVSTVTRAFGEVIRTGLIEASGRRGTRVRSGVAWPSASENAQFSLDLRGHQSPLPDWGDRLRRVMMDAALDVRTNASFAYESGPGRQEQREAGALWLRHVTGSKIELGRIVLCNGAQHALLCALLVACNSGDCIATERLTYAGLKSIAPVLGLKLLPVEIDQDGLIPASLDRVCRKGLIKVLVTVPDVHNPTTATQPLKRRKEIARVAEKHRLTIIEDAVYAGLAPQQIASITELTDARAIRIVGLSKTIGPGLRIGYLDAPISLINQLVAALRATSWMASPIQAEIATRLILDGTAAKLLAENREELIRRNRLVEEALAEFDIRTLTTSPHAWLQLPEPWTRESFQAWGQKSGVLTLSADAFAVSREFTDHAIRLSVSAASSSEALRAGLEQIADALHNPDALTEALA